MLQIKFKWPGGGPRASTQLRVVQRLFKGCSTNHWTNVVLDWHCGTAALRQPRCLLACLVGSLAVGSYVQPLRATWESRNTESRVGDSVYRSQREKSWSKNSPRLTLFLTRFLCSYSLKIWKCLTQLFKFRNAFLDWKTGVASWFQDIECKGVVGGVRLRDNSGIALICLLQQINHSLSTDGSEAWQQNR